MNYTDPRCVRLRAAYGFEGYGILHCILDMLAANGGYVPADFEAIALHLSVSADIVRAVACDFNIFPPVADDGMLRHPDAAVCRPAYTPMSRTERARRAANARWHKQSDTTLPATEQPQSPQSLQSIFSTPKIEEKPPSQPPPTQTELPLDLPPLKPPAPLKQQAVAAWCDTYKAHFGIPYQVAPRDAGTIANILQRLRKTAAQLGNPSPADTELLDSIQIFFHTALADPFISDNVSLTLLQSQYNRIIKNIYHATDSNTARPRASTGNGTTATVRPRAARDDPGYLADLAQRIATSNTAGFVGNTG